MSGEAFVPEKDESDLESALEWSVSAISSASGFDPDQYTRENIRTPDSSRIGRDELDRLVDKINDLKNNMVTISEKSVTPTNSPRADNKTVIENAGHTPPVKDVGLNSDPGNLEAMRRKLQDLEKSSRDTVASRRSLKFSGEKSNDDKLNEILERSKSAKNEQLEKEKEYNVELCKQIEVLKSQLEQEKNHNIELEKAVGVLKQQFAHQALEIKTLNGELVKRNQLISEIKPMWTQAVEELNKQRNAHMKLKSEQNEARSQLNKCQNDLEKALKLATEFKQTIDENEEIKKELEDKLFKQNEANNTEIAHITQDKTELQEQMKILQTQLEQVIVDKQNYEKVMARERDQFEVEKNHWKSQHDQRESDFDNKLKMELRANEESLHAFYVTQMQSIISEKVESLQGHVNTWEIKKNGEKDEALRNLQEKHNQQIEIALHNLQEKHNLQIESFKRQFSQLEAQLKASEAIHIASKKEAKVLKGQLEGPSFQPSTSSSSTDGDEAVRTVSRRSLPNSHLNNKKGRKMSTSRMSSVSSFRVRNNLKDEIRPSSAAANLGSTFKATPLDVEVPSHTLNQPRETTFTEEPTDHNASTALWTSSSSEKKDLVTTFIKQFLEDNPEAVLDPGMMAALSEKANKLIDSSFHYVD